MDTIYREQAIEVADAIWVVTGDKNVAKVWQQLQDLPSAEKTGKWIDGWRSGLDGTRYWYRACSECGYERDDDDAEKDTNYCPNCGARMEV